MMLLDALIGMVLLGSVLVVGPDGPYQSLPEALAAAQDGDVVEVHGGVHGGPIVVERTIELRGVGRPVLDGGGQGTVVTLAAPGASLRGFEVRGSGSDLNAADAGIYARAQRTTIEDNQLADVLFGISLDDAAWSVVRGNLVRGKPLPPAERGDGLRLWYSSDVLFENNRVEAVRDCVFWYSERLRIVGNTIENGRYGLHFMYNDGAVVEGNVLRANSVGAYLMYTHGVVVRGNLLAANRGPSGLGLGLKDVDNLEVEGNWLVDNRAGAYIDNSPTSLRARSSFRDNAFAFNDIGLVLLPNVQRNTFAQNAFRENLQQVSVQGGGTLRGNQWTEAGRGNYWSDYRGFDTLGDGLGDVPYRAEALLGDLMDKQPPLRLFQFGLAASAVEFAAQAFPALRPAAKVVDEAPLLAAPTLPPPPGLAPPDPRPALGVALGLLGLAGGVLAASRARLGSGRASAERRTGGAPGRTAPVLEVAGLTKAFGQVLTVDGLDFSVKTGETVALWGPNGAGKTTAVKCLLGLLPCSGRISIAGRDARRDGRAARRALGYVPQEVAFHDDLTVGETLRFYARLKRVSPEDGRALLETLGLTEHIGKRIGALSGGLKQRLALALALLGDPPLLLLDEPTSNLDAAGRDQVLRLLTGLRQRGSALLFASHRLEEVEVLADRVIVLERGRLAFSCPPGDLARRLGLHQGMRLRVSQERWSDALGVLRAGGLRASPNGSAIHVDVRPSEKALPIRLLEGAGIVVADFSLEDGAAIPRGGEEGPRP